jgi:hypothetical protein
MATTTYPEAALAGRSAGSSNMGLVLGIGSCLLLNAGLWIAGKPQFLRLAIPAAACLIGILLYSVRPLTYVTFSLWVWFIAPLVRRFVDWHFGFVEPNFVLLAPFLVSGVSLLSLLPSHRVKSRVPLAFMLCGAAILYGFMVGMLLQPSAEVLFGLLNWLCPLLLGLHLYLHWPQYELYKAAISRSFLWGVLILGAYGVYQFFLPPAWDRYWLDNVLSTSPSFGLPEPLQVRVFSAVNSPGPFANVMMAGLLLLFSLRSPLKLPAAIAGYLSFLLSVVRTAWLSWVIGFILIVKSANPRIIVRLVLSILVLLACLVPLANDPRLSTVIGDRLNTFSDLGHDESYGARLDLYRALTEDAIGHPFGYGLKTLDMAHGKIDSGLFALVFSLGWLGSAMFVIGLLFIFLGNMQALQKSDTFLVAAQAITLAILAQSLSGPIFVNLTAALFWVFAGIYLAGNQYHKALATAVAEAPAARA